MPLINQITLLNSLISYRAESQKKIYESIISAYESSERGNTKEEEKKEEPSNVNIYLQKQSSGR